MSTKMKFTTLIAGLLLLGALAWAPGCSAPTRGDVDETAPVSTASAAAAPSAGGAQLWAETCARCHNLRSPATYSAAQWDVIVSHMRVRGSITGEDARTIVEFLKAAAGESAK